MHRSLSAIAGILAIVLLAGCQRVLVPTPNLYVHAAEDPFAEVPSELQTTAADLLYVTDREPVDDARGGVRYGYGRSMSMAFGSCVVEIGPDATWDELVEASRSSKRSVSLPLALGRIEEIGRFPATPPPLEIVDGEELPSAAYEQEREAAIGAFHRELERRLAASRSKRVVIFVHGFKTTFQDAAFRLAELWHFLGREGVPAALHVAGRRSGAREGLHARSRVRRVHDLPPQGGPPRAGGVSGGRAGRPRVAQPRNRRGLHDAAGAVHGGPGGRARSAGAVPDRARGLRGAGSRPRGGLAAVLGGAGGPDRSTRHGVRLAERPCARFGGVALLVAQSARQDTTGNA